MTPETPAPTVEAASAAGGTLRIGVGVDPVSIDPRYIADDEGELIVDAIFDPLVRLDDDLQVVSAAARRWQVSDDHRTFTFTLHDARFHDGTLVTAHDFVRTFNQIADGTAAEPSYLSYLLENVEGFAAAQRSGARLTGVEAPDAHTLVIRLQAPDPGFVETLTDPSLVPLPALAVEDAAAFARQPVGNGPFMMAGPREPNAFVRLVRFEEYPTPALLDEVLITVYAGDQGRERQWRDVQEGTLHVAELAANRVDDAVAAYGRGDEGYRGPGVLDGISSTAYLYAFDTSQPPFDDPRVRRAISLSIDREALATEVTQDARVAATSLVPPSIPGARPAACSACRHNPDLARALLDEVRAETAADEEGEHDAPEPPPGQLPAGDDEEAGQGEEAVVTLSADDDDPQPQDPDGQAPGQTPLEGDPSPDTTPAVLDRLTLTHNRGVTHAAIAERMAADISDALGIDVTFRAREFRQLFHDVHDGQVAVFRVGWDSNEPHPGGYLRPLFHSSQLGVDNVAGYDRPEVDALLDVARATEDPRQRLVTYGVAERAILADLPVMPILWHRHLRVVVPEVQDLVLSPLGRINLARVWLDPDSR